MQVPRADIESLWSEKGTSRTAVCESHLGCFLWGALGAGGQCSGVTVTRWRRHGKCQEGKLTGVGDIKDSTPGL